MRLFLGTVLEWVFMKGFSLFAATVAAFVPLFAAAAAEPTTEMRSSVVFIANYNSSGDFIGWGSGFYVDEGIVVTNKHVIEGGARYRIYATSDEDTVDFDCYTRITKSDVRVNLNDDVAYIRVYLPCAHGEMRFVDDPEDGAPVSVVGYPWRGSLENSLTLKITSGVVLGETYDGWLATDALLDIGNSGGPVVNDEGVVGVAVAKTTDEAGNFEAGYFIPSTVIVNGLLYANNSDFGYDPQDELPSSRSSSSASSSSSSSNSVSSNSSSHSSSSSSPSSHSFSSSSSTRPVTPFEARVCARVEKRFSSDVTMFARINVRLQKRFGFQCVR